MSNKTGAEELMITSCEHLGTVFVVCGVMFVLVTLLLSLTLNGFIFMSFYVDSTLRTLPYVFIVNLAITDVMSSLILIPMDITYLVNFPKLPLPGIVNNLWNAIFLSLLTASILNFTAVSLDRYIRIRYPLHYMYYLTKERVIQLVVALWIYVVVLGVLMFAAFESPIDGVYTFEISASYFIPFLICNVFLPFCVIIALYGCIFRIMRRHMRCIDVQTSARLRCSQGMVPVRRQNSLLRDLSSSKTVAW
ncbi:hypothetical protein QZH41_006831 [Actinostola sp. cb2023]|nr:hypothetical protein QZH41_006831 [Actinostola sp. cb2023]